MSKKNKAKNINDKQANFVSGGTCDHSKMTAEQIKEQEERVNQAEIDKKHKMLGGSNNNPK